MPSRIANNKGGTGKTTTAVNLGATLAEKDFSVLEIDLDPQANLSINLGVDIDNLESTVYDVLLNPEDIPINQVIISGLPNNIDLSGATVELMNEISRESILKRTLLDVKEDYDFILVDCPPNLGLLTLNALTAADLVIVPTQTEYLAMRTLRYTRGRYIDLFIKVSCNQRANKHHRQGESSELDMKLLCTMLDRRTIHGRDVIEELREVFRHQVFDTVITSGSFYLAKRTIKFADASVAAEPILSYAPKSEAAEQYRNLAKEVLSYVKETKS